jgi:hypothetical protein
LVYQADHRMWSDRKGAEPGLTMSEVAATRRRTRPDQAIRMLRCVARVARVTPLLLGFAACDSAPLGPVPNLSVVRATDLGTLPTTATIRGRDGGYSAVFQGRSVWLYGDTFLSRADARGRTLISDSWSWTTNLDATNGITGFQERLDAAGMPTMILPETSPESTYNANHQGDPCQVQPCGDRWALWPGPLVTDSVRNRALIFYMLVYAKPGNFNFSGVGTSVAIWDSFDDTPRRPIIDPSARCTTCLFAENETPYGSAALTVAGMLYVYGCANSGFTNTCKLGRVDPADVLDRTAWSYYAGAGAWSPRIGDAVTVLNGNDILSISWNAYLNRYVAVYSPPLSLDVMMRTSPAPQGPWSREIRAFTAMPPSGGGTVYDAQAHPEYDVDGGRVMYVTYSRTTGSFTSEIRVVSIEVTPSSTPSE